MSDRMHDVYTELDWYVVLRKRKISENFNWRDVDQECMWHGRRSRILCRRKGAFRVRGRIKSFFRYRVHAIWYHVMTPPMGSQNIEHYPDALAFRDLPTAIKAGQVLAGMQNMDDRAKAVAFIDEHRMRA